jgi:hypothetical protein
MAGAFFAGGIPVPAGCRLFPSGSPVIMYGDIPECNINGEGVDKKENRS